MTVQELIFLLKKCKPTARVVFCNGNDRIDEINFVEHCLTDSSALLYEDEPSWDNESSDDRDIELASISTNGEPCFAETTYRDL